MFFMVGSMKSDQCLQSSN